MKNFLLALLVAFAALPALGAGSAVTMMSAQASAGNGASLVTTQASPAELGGDSYVFGYSTDATAAPFPVVVIEMSLNATDYSVVHVFGNHGAAEVWATPVCGGAGACRWRARKTLSTTPTATILAVCSGTAVCAAP